MASREDLESYINRLGDEITSDEVESGIWVLNTSDNGTPVIVSYDPPVVVFRVNVMNLPDGGPKRSELMQRLLELNAGDLVHGSYGIEGSSVILSDAHELENLDFNEFQSSVESLSMAVASHMADLASYKE